MKLITAQSVCHEVYSGLGLIFMLHNYTDMKYK